LISAATTVISASRYSQAISHQVGGWGILLARTLCDAVQIRTGSDGTLVRVRVRLPAPSPEV
jgi:hypothetical protein